MTQDTPTAQPSIAYPNEGGFVFPASGDVPEFRSTLWITPEEAAPYRDDNGWVEPDAGEAFTPRMQEQYDTFVAALQPAAPVEETVESLQQQIDAIDQQVRDLTRQRLDLEDRQAALTAVSR